MSASNQQFFLYDAVPRGSFCSGKKILFRVVLFLIGVIATSGLTNAQIDTSGGTLYRLNQDSTFQEGCFPPCLCPITEAVPVKGTFVLTPTGFDGLYNTYAITDVNWLTSSGGAETIVTGRGTYKIGGEVALQQQLILDLRIGSNKPEHFDSGLV